jgi:hypothetical protein
MSYFQQYEQRRKRFSTGTIWVDQYDHIVCRLKVVSESELDDLNSVYELPLRCNGNDITFRILESKNIGGNLGRGSLVRWSRHYMEENYCPEFSL